MGIGRETGATASVRDRRIILANVTVSIGIDFILEARSNRVIALTEWRVGSPKRGRVKTGYV